jgi:hypothetical protein
MNKYKNKPSGKYRSKLELMAASLLADNGIIYYYEPKTVTLLDKFSYNSTERVGKLFKEVNKIRAITYTPDFVGLFWIMETKGKKTPDFLLKWKLFKTYLIGKNLYPHLFLPTNKREILVCVENILDVENSKEVLNLKKLNLKEIL